MIACVSPCPANFCLISATEWFQYCVLIRVLAPTKALGKSDPEKCLCGRSSRRSSCWHSGRTCSQGMLWSAFPRQSAAGSGPDRSRMAYDPGSGSGPASSRTGPSSSLISSHYAPYGPAASQSRLRPPVPAYAQLAASQGGQDGDTVYSDGGTKHALRKKLKMEDEFGRDADRDEEGYCRGRAIEYGVVRVQRSEEFSGRLQTG